MGFPITVRLYGTNTQPTSLEILKTTLDADSTTYPYWEFSAYTINSSFVYENENRTDLGNRVSSKNIVRPTFEVKVAPARIPKTASDLQTFYKTNVFSKRYHYFWFNSYTLPNSGTASTECLAVAITDVQIEPNYELGSKDLVITMQKMFAEA